MRYYLLVSHGVFAPGLHSAVSMMAGSERTDIRSTSLEDGMDVPTYRAAFEKLVADITADDEILLFGDIIGGSPLTNAVEILTEKGLLEHTVAIGGMNLPLVLTAVFADEDESLQDVAREAMEESAQQIRQFTMSNDDEDDDI